MTTKVTDKAPAKEKKVKITAKPEFEVGDTVINKTGDAIFAIVKIQYKDWKWMYLDACGRQFPGEVLSLYNK